MEYNLSNVHLKIKQFADKVGSDYFPLPIILNFFETSTLDFLGERLKHIEKTQEITDDISSLVVSSDLPLIDINIGNPNLLEKFAAAIPVDYHRLIAYDVRYNDGTRCRRADLLRQAEYHSARNNPHKEPTKQYPIILQESNLFQVNFGPPFSFVTTGNIFSLTYCKKPTFATTGESTTRIVNMSDEAIEKILYKTVMNLFNKTGDQRIETTAKLEESYRNLFR